MVKYIEYTKVNTKHTVLEFRGGSEDVSVTNFTGEDMFANVVSITGESETDIDNLINTQPEEINCIELVQAEFKALVRNSDQLQNIRRIVKSEIAKKYDIADEIALSKLDVDDLKRTSYEEYISFCILSGSKLKTNIGY